MGKREWKLSILLLIALVLVISCRGRVPQGEQPLETEAAIRLVQTGTQGIELKIIPNYPPPLVYDKNELVALVEVQNRGNDEVDLQDCFVQITGFDTNIILGEFGQSKPCAFNLAGPLEGKNVYNVQGGANQLEFRSTNIALPEGVYEYDPKFILFKTCYLYHTKARPTVCIDPLFYQITAEQKACDFRKSVPTGGGQGAPVGISYVGVQMAGGKAVFEINVVNLGGGKVVTDNTDIRNCDSGIEYTDLDKVRYTVQMTSGTMESCKPQDQYVRLTNGQGKIVCTFNLPNTGAYETPLLIDLDYGYIKSYQQPLKIIQTPQ